MVTQPVKPDDLEIKKRARSIRLVLSDNDGVLTDTGVYYADSGEVMKRFSIRDGMGVERLRAVGIATGIMSGEHSPSIQARADKLAIRHVYLGVRDKQAKLAEIVAENGLQHHEIAYIGDDFNDLEIIRTLNRHGLTAAPQDAMPDIINAVIFHCNTKGGQGAFREFAEWIIAHRS